MLVVLTRRWEMSDAAQLAKLRELIAALDPITWGGGDITLAMRNAAAELSVFYRDKFRCHDDEAFCAAILATGIVKVYGSRLTKGSPLAFHLYEPLRARNHLINMGLEDSAQLRTMWRLGRLADEQIATLEGRPAPKSPAELLVQWEKVQRLAAEHTSSSNPRIRSLVRAVRQLPKLSVHHYDPRLEQQLFSAQKFWPQEPDSPIGQSRLLS